MSTVRTATLALLRDLRMTTIFGNPGSTELPMFRDFPSDFRYILGLQESVVLAMADGYAQGTGHAALVNLHATAGTGHALGNLFTAYKNQTPLVVTAGQQARSILPFEPFLFAERPTEFPRPFVKWAVEPARAEDVPGAIARAFVVAMQPPRGPTFVSIPIDDWERPCDPAPVPRASGTNPGDPALLAEAAALLARARRPALVLGAGVARDHGWARAIALAERHQAQVYVAPFNARCSFPEDHPLFAGFLDPMREAIVAALSAHDVIIALGGPLSLYHVEGSGPHLPPGATTVFIADNPAHVSWAPCDLGIVAHADHALAALLAGPAPMPRPAPPPRAAPPAIDATVLTDRLVFDRLAALRPADAIVVEEAPTARGPMHSHLPITMPDSFFTCASGGLGHGLPAAIGMALARPDRRVIAVLGDGSAMYAIQGLWTAAQLGLPISFLILNNRRYEALRGFGRLFGMQTVAGTDLSGLDFCGLATAQGIAARHIDSAAQVDAALAWSFAATGPTLLEMMIA
jgi:benzoylformate decarboxylase